MLLRNVALILASFILGTSLTAQAETTDAEAIFTKAYNTQRVDDQIATLNFTFALPGKKKQHFVYTMVWKNMKGEDGYDNKAMFFGEYPPDRRGIAYLGWLTPPGSAKQDDEWIYLPELRMTRRIAHRDRSHAHDDDEFGNSLLKREHLDPRPPGLDVHTLSGEEMLDGRMHYLITSTPKQRREGEAAQTIRWVDKESYRINRAQYFDAHGKETLDIQFNWTQIDQYWVWKSVTAVNPESLAQTVMDIDTARINIGLKDRTFTKRILEKGSAKFRR